MTSLGKMVSKHVILNLFQDLEPVFKFIRPRFFVNFCSFLHKIFQNIPDIMKNFMQKSLKIS
ncbi:MAG: hypothetical protein A2887_03545 [Alphaproteobacteria bacterium RIFCSPLOWO2_01_FULL_40_26]|nr:MAG: hypothetical protein A3D15_04700 [Alphaproteobacteria bacterium RIFCSPHIGHO2_02_FULL_40_34]OFW95273.1 MAG: hypothetical protein A2887_03545 [Alphaproteobacteria bacterium RIFCSPLOWO2_01_FULL_40_26]OFX09176.1 MAG: hypothetical protein A3H30_06250 [Alphaproteobacteria bacterium RIFCSPLOWO2_02_FULL_40_19]OFX11532.1 MAG: hypothetical protein A3G22_04855 [Alphaproteobacteria bacterium RIFCSPLOWO2_12_FULL_40_11]